MEDTFFISRPTTNVKAKIQAVDLVNMSPEKYIGGLRKAFFKASSNKQTLNQQEWNTSGIQTFVSPKETYRKFMLLFNKIDANNTGVIHWKDLESFMIHKTAPETKFVHSNVDMIKKKNVPKEVIKNAHRDPIKQIYVAPWLNSVITISNETIKMWKRSTFECTMTIPSSVDFTCFCPFENSQIIAVALASRRIIFYHINEPSLLPVQISASPTSEIIKSMSAAETRNYLKKEKSKPPIYDLPTVMIEASITEKKAFQYKMLVADKNGGVSLISLSTPQRRNGTDYSVELVSKNRIQKDEITQVMVIKPLKVYASSSLDRTITFFTTFDDKICTERVFREEFPITTFTFLENTLSLVFCMKNSVPSVWTIHPPTRQLKILSQLATVNIAFSYEQFPGEKMFVTISEHSDIRFFNSNSFIPLNEYSDSKLDCNVNAAAIDEENKTIIVGTRYPICWKSIQNTKSSDDIVTHNSKIVGVKFMPEFDKIVSFDTNGFYNICDYQIGKIEVFNKVRSVNIHCIETDAGRRIFTSTNKGEVEVWNAFSSELISTIPRQVSGTITCMKYFISKDKKYLAYGTSSMQLVIFFEQMPGKFIHHASFSGSEKEITCIDFDPLSELIIAGSSGGEILSYPLELNGISKRMTFPDESEIIAMKIVMHNLYIVSSKQIITILVLPSMRIDSNIVGLNPSIPHTLTSIDANDNIAVTGDSNGYIRVWNVVHGRFTSLKHDKTIRCHEKEILDVLLINEGNNLVTTATDNLVRLWDVSTMEFIGTFCSKSFWNTQLSDTWMKVNIPSDPRYNEISKPVNMPMKSTRSISGLVKVSSRKSITQNRPSQTLRDALQAVKSSRKSMSIQEDDPKDEIEEKPFDFEKAYNIVTSYYSEDYHDIEINLPVKHEPQKETFRDPLMTNLLSSSPMDRIKNLTEPEFKDNKPERIKHTLSMIVRPTVHKTFI